MVTLRLGFTNKTISVRDTSIGRYKLSRYNNYHLFTRDEYKILEEIFEEMKKEYEYSAIPHATACIDDQIVYLISPKYMGIVRRIGEKMLIDRLTIKTADILTFEYEYEVNK